LRHPSFTVVTQKRKRRKFASPVRNVLSTRCFYSVDEYLMNMNHSNPINHCNNEILFCDVFTIFFILLFLCLYIFMTYCTLHCHFDKILDHAMHNNAYLHVHKNVTISHRKTPSCCQDTLLKGCYIQLGFLRCVYWYSLCLVIYFNPSAKS
jgi:hypothetical protein